VMLVFLTLTLVVPFVLLVIDLVLWVVPLMPTRQRSLLRFSYILDCWAALDVFFVAVCIYFVELERIAKKFVYRGHIGEFCKGVDMTFGEECFDVGIGFHSGFVALFLAALALFILPKWIHQRCSATMDAALPTLQIEATIDTRPTFLVKDAELPKSAMSSRSVIGPTLLGQEITSPVKRGTVQDQTPASVSTCAEGLTPFNIGRWTSVCTDLSSLGQESTPTPVMQSIQI